MVHGVVEPDSWNWPEEPMEREQPTYQEIQRWRDIERAAIQLLQFLPPNTEPHIPTSNLRVALGIVQPHERSDDPAIARREAEMIARSMEGLSR